MKEIGKVYSSTDYDKFSMLDSNRDIRQAHVNELVGSMKEHPLEKAIDVNEKLQIIDGQHRFTAWKILGMPIIFTIHKGWGEKEVPVLNTHQKNWNPSDFVKMYAEIGNDNYKKYAEFVSRYGFTHHANLLLLGGGRDIEFKEGLFRVKKWDFANIKAKEITEIKVFYEGIKRYAFVSAYLQVSQDSSFEHKTFLEKLKYQSRKLVDCTTTADYFELIKEIYNYRKKGSLVTMKYNPAIFKNKV